jgi:UDP-N-acetylmuramoyl-L-alanyl-D-glutamate--2,6-diaminopimelate ligase
MLPLPGDFNVANAAIVLAYLLASGVDLDKASDVMSLTEAPSGRMQRAPRTDRAVYIDYAHTPDAIESALKALRPHCRGELWCVFGCGGERDIGKRPLMAKLAERLADRVVITSDNPRSEGPTEIINDIVSGLTEVENATIIEDRAAAISWAIANAAPSDFVLIAGKGHENYQEVNGKCRPFSDIALANRAAKSWEASE